VDLIRQPHKGVHLEEWLCEFIGTFILIAGGLSAVFFDFSPELPMSHIVASHSLRLLITGLIFAGFGSLVAVTPIGKLSGAHLNPSVTLGFWLKRYIHTIDAIAYIIAQAGGAITASVFLKFMWGNLAKPFNYGITQPAHGLPAWQAMLIEMLMTSILVTTILWFLAHQKLSQFTPLAVWIVVALLVWQGAPYTGASLNPARSLGPAVISHDYTNIWVYFIGPPLGAVVAVAAFVVHSPKRLLTSAKMFHDPKYRSILAGTLPSRSVD